MSEDAFVYLLACSDASLYCGWTTDLDRRLATHGSGRGGAYTRARLPVRIAAAWRCTSRAQARALEVRVKRLPRTTKLALADGRVVLETACGLTTGDGERPVRL